jgi:nicotinamidase-related amidase
MYRTVALASEHWCSSVFANADFDLQLRKHGIHQPIVVGLIAHACIEAAVRHEAEFGYEIRVVRDAGGPDENDARRSQHQYAGLQHRHRHDKRARPLAGMPWQLAARRRPRTRLRGDTYV